MANYLHEIRDPIHIFIRLNSHELKVLNSRPFQRLRHIHQLGLTHLVYPGASHRRFEHSLGVMELAGRVYDVVTSTTNYTHESLKDINLKDSFTHQYWRQTLRMAALCHDLGHLPFSHAAEKDLLPENWDHEKLTVQLIHSDELESIWKEIKIQSDDVAKLAVGPKKLPEKHFTDWEAILAEIIVGDAFGVDRMDYLLRDSYHVGVVYGKFDHYRLIDTLKILPKEEDGSKEPCLGVDMGGLHSAEALLLARYLMFSQVYCHPVRMIYDIHLKDFLKQWLDHGNFSIDSEDHLLITDNEVTAEILSASRNKNHKGHEPARRIVNREHFRLLYERNPNDVTINPEAAKKIFESACEKFNKTAVRYDSYRQEGGGINFPVLTKDDRIVNSLSLSETLKEVPVVAKDYVFISLENRNEAEKWLKENRQRIIAPRKEDE